jgi:hypothetical protein
MQISRRVRDLVRRYVPAEVGGTVTAVAGAWLGLRFGGSPWIAALCGSLGENVGYYGVIVARDLRDARRRGADPWRVLPGILVEFGPGELLDTFVVRPALMAAGPLLTGGLTTGTIAGKLAADVVFYAVVVPSARLRHRLVGSPPRAGERTSEEAGAVERTSEEAGPPTPYLSMDLDLVERAYRALRTALPEARIHYAVKCNPDRPILRRLHALGASFEIASAAELTDLIAIGARPAEVLFSNPVKVPGHAASAVYVRLATAPADSAVPSEGKFGIDPVAARTLMLRARALGLQPHGITFHVGSQMVDPTAWASAIERAGRLMSVLLDDGIRITLLDLGGGSPPATTPTIRTWTRTPNTSAPPSTRTCRTRSSPAGRSSRKRVSCTPPSSASPGAATSGGRTWTSVRSTG